MATVKQVLNLAREQIGRCESPTNSNNVLYNTWYYGREINGIAYPWCMVFIMWLLWKCGISVPIRTASCGELMRAAQKQNVWFTTNFQPGDIVIYDFSGKQTTTQHCGIVEEVLHDYGVQAIEGNTSIAGSQDNGGMVCRKTRARKYIIGAVRPVYDAEIKQEDVSKMTIKEFIDKLTDEQAYTLLQKAQKYAATLPLPDWAKGEMEEAINMGITDGTRPLELTPRYQTAIMTKRSAEKK